MSEIDFNYSISSIHSSISEEPPPSKRKKLAYPSHKKGYCNCRMCKTCHPNQPKLTLEEIQIIRKKAAQNKNPKPKRCTKECAYCQKVIERRNYFANQQKNKDEGAIINQIQGNSNEEAQLNANEETINIKETTEYLKTTNPNEMGIKLLETEKDGNCLINSILKSIGINTTYSIGLRKLLGRLIKETNIEEDIIKGLNYNTKEEYINYITTDKNWCGYQELTYLSIKYNILIAIYSPPTKYKNYDRWYFIYDQNKNSACSIIMLDYKESQNNERDLNQHYSGYDITKYIKNQDKIKFKILNELMKEQEPIIHQNNMNQIENEIKILLWNTNSIKDYTKKLFLIETMLVNKIHIALLQETMLKDNDKMYIKGYRIYRSNSEFRKGTAILISNSIDAQTYVVMKSQEGRYLKLKIKNEKDNTEITISNIYLEPDKENSYEELIPEGIRNADCIGGDLNKAETGMAIHSNVYHTYNLGEKIETIQVDHKISDHPILIFKKRLNIPLIENNETIKILDNKAIEENNLNIHKLVNTEVTSTTFINPNKTINPKPFECQPNNNNNWDNFEIIKKQNIELYKTQKQKNKQDIQYLLKNNELGADPWLKLTSLMLTNRSNIFWKPNSTSEKTEITTGFKELYKHKQNKEKIPHNKILELMIQDMRYITENQEQFRNFPAPFNPKSNARDINGLSQKIIMKIVNKNSKNIIDTATNFLKLLYKIELSQGSNIIIHTTSRIILKKKKQNIETWADLRSLSIMPAMIMVHDKILRSIVTAIIDPNLNENQFGGRIGQDTTLARILLNYKAINNRLNKILLIDLKKAFDCVDRKILKEKINNDNNINEINKALLNNILTIYDSININILNDIIEPTRGVPQGSVFGPIFFTYYVNNLITNIQNKYKDKINIQAFIDDIALQAEDTNTIQEAFNDINEEISKLNMEINTKKCELITNNIGETITNIKTDEIVPSTQQAKYLGQILNEKGEPTSIITKEQLGSIGKVIGINSKSIPIRTHIKIFKIWMKSKINHLLPIIALTKGIFESWKNIRKVIFTPILNRLTLPLEAASLMGLSFFETFVKPLLKIKDKYIENKKDELTQYINNALNKTLIEWKNAEPNLDNTILINIEQSLAGQTPETKKWIVDVHKQAIKRLFRNNIIPQINDKIIDLKLPQIINLMSNAPTHILEGIIKNNSNRLNNEETKKQINNQLLPYIIIKNTESIEIPKIQKPNKEDVDEIIEYQTIYSIAISNMANKKINENLDESNKTIKEKLYNFREDEQGNIILNQSIYELINKIRFKLYNMSKAEWNYYEDLIEEIHKNLNLKNATIKEKKKVGRPKKKENINSNLNQIKINTFIKNIQNKEQNSNARDGMDLDN